MGEKWNHKDLMPPPVYQVQKKTEEVENGVLCSMKRITSDLVTSLSHQATLELEKFYLGKIIYKLNNQQRHEKSYRYLRLVWKCLSRYLDLGLLTMMKSLAEEFERLLNQPEEQPYLPSFQTLQFHLVRLQGGAGLMAQMATYCTQAYIISPIKQQMIHGHFLDKNLLYLGILGRLWTMSRYLVTEIGKAYNQIHPLLTTFPASPMPWLPQDEDLPSDLTVWIQTNWPELDSSHKSNKPSDDLSKPVNGQVILESEKSNTELLPLNSNKSDVFGPEEDVGVPVSDLQKNQPIRKKVVKRFTIDVDFEFLEKTMLECNNYEDLLEVCAQLKLGICLFKKVKVQKWTRKVLNIENNVQQLTDTSLKKTQKSFLRWKKKTCQLQKLMFLGSKQQLLLNQPKLSCVLSILKHYVCNVSDVHSAISSLALHQNLAFGPFNIVLPKRTSAAIINILSGIKGMSSKALKKGTAIRSFNSAVISSIKSQRTEVGALSVSEEGSDACSDEEAERRPSKRKCGREPATAPADIPAPKTGDSGNTHVRPSKTKRDEKKKKKKKTLKNKNRKPLQKKKLKKIK